MRRIGIGVVGLGLLGACSPDYSAVRDWSLQARDVVLPAPADRVVPDPWRLPPPPAEITAEGRAGAVQALQEAAAAWLGFLAYMADDGLPTARTNPLAALVPKVEPFDPAGAAAVTQLGTLMAKAARQNYRAPELRYAIDEGAPHVQGVLAALLRQTDALAGGVPEGAAAARHAAIARVAAGQALMASRTASLSRPETARMLREQETELRRIMALAEG
ncbi:hypothetical protein [Falsiroseomonas oryzae]|uniref:hypothetical protein n=1 Tax=Falsiroseomonas oryzae TaxID=2766473 RepID=UPI0022EB1709|nr:hypothetical protein [Roseomonas sp. MO-31]